jgi:hypothetical protein
MVSSARCLLSRGLPAGPISHSSTDAPLWHGGVARRGRRAVLARRDGRGRRGWEDLRELPASPHGHQGCVCRGLLGLTCGRLGARVQLALFKSRFGAEEGHHASYRLERMPLTAAMDAAPGAVGRALRRWRGRS